MKLICAYCKKQFNGRKERKFCSKYCYIKWSKGKKFGPGRPQKRKIKICIICKKKFEYHVCREAKYCSKKCWRKRKPQILNQCLYCGKDFWDYKSENRKYCLRKCYCLHKRELLKGKNSHFWKGNKTKLNQLIRTRVEYIEWRKAVFERDNYTCQECEIKSGDGHRIYLQAHHIKSFSRFPKLRFNVNNGTTLCKNCHLLEHFHKF